MENQALVFLKGNTPVTTSLIIAERTENEHESIMRLIQKHQDRFGRWGKIYFSDLKSGNKKGDLRGRPTRIALLNEQQATFLITLLRNNDIVLDFKGELVDRFYKMREILLNRRNEEWQQIRLAGKRGNQKMCDAVHDVIVPLARAAGSTTPERMLYMNYQKLINKAAGINPKSRDELPITLLYEVEKMQSIADVSIRGLAARGEDDFHKIYRDTKQTLENYSRLSLITERFLPT